MSDGHAAKPPTSAASEPEKSGPAVSTDPLEATYKKPEHGWTCFHCGETFKTLGGARDHFGAKPGAMPGCMIRVQFGNERGLEMALRKAEAAEATLRGSLEALVPKWRKDAIDPDEGMTVAYQRCADQLEAALAARTAAPTPEVLTALADLRCIAQLTPKWDDRLRAIATTLAAALAGGLEVAGSRPLLDAAREASEEIRDLVADGLHARAQKTGNGCPPTWTGHWREWYRSEADDLLRRSSAAQPATSKASAPLSDAAREMLLSKAIQLESTVCATRSEERTYDEAAKFIRAALSGTAAPTREERS